MRICLDISPAVHRHAGLGRYTHELTAALLAARRRDLSLVDCTSFELMRRLGIHTAFAFGRHFAEQGFEILPPA